MNLAEDYMKMAIELAKKGLGNVSPNPMVGCLIVHNDIIIGKGYHKTYGGHHAEVNAFNDVQDKGKIQESTVYVTLEPCNHFGKTPPCADLIIKSHPKKVVICNEDPNPLVAGKGIQKIREAGIEVEVGVLELEGRELNRRFFSLIEKKRPYIILKWAETQDGFVAKENYDSKWITNEKSRALVHQWRSEEDAIMVGTNTALYDDPQLTVRMIDSDNHPLRIVIDKKLSLSHDLKLFDNSTPTICYNNIKSTVELKNEFVQIDFEQDIISQILMDLGKRNISSLIVEGGAKLLQSFIDINLWDEARVFIGDKEFKQGIKAPYMNEKPVRQEIIGKDILKYYINKLK